MSKQNANSLKDKQCTSTLEKMNLAGTLIALTFTGLIILNACGFITIVMAVAIIFIFRDEIFHNNTKKYWEKITIVVIKAVLVASLAVFWFFPRYQDLIRTFFGGFCCSLMVMYLVLAIIFKINNKKGK